MWRIWILILLLLASTGAEPLDLQTLLSQPSSAQQIADLQGLLTTNPELLKKRVRKPNGRGRVSLLVYALEKGDPKLAGMLLKLGLNPDQTEGPGKRPVLHHVFSGATSDAQRLTLLDLLSETSSKPNQSDKLQRNLFHALVESKNWQETSSIQSAAEKLKSLSVPIEQEDVRGMTPLMAAVMRHDARMVEVLLKIGADPKRTSEGMSLDAVTLAEQQSHTIDHPVEAAEVVRVIQANL